VVLEERQLDPEEIEQALARFGVAGPSAGSRGLAAGRRLSIVVDNRMRIFCTRSWQAVVTALLLIDGAQLFSIRTCRSPGEGRVGQDSEVIRLESLTKNFGALRVLDNISISLCEGVTGLLGPNGAGKSTLIKVLLGLLRATSGSARVLGMDVHHQSRAIRERVGFMPEDDCYLPALTGIESVQFAAQLCRIPPIEALRRAHEILDFCGAGQERYRQVETYSTGMRQKLKFAQTLVHDPPLLILDEPTSGLDPDERDAMLNRIRVLARQHRKSVILCTHILPDVQAVSDSVVILADGRIRVADRLDNLSQPASPALLVRAVGSSSSLQEALARRGLRTELTPDGSVSVHAAGQDAAAALIWSAALETGTLVRSMTPTRNSLEAIFLAAVKGGEDANS
jgi:ABC-2 type transport system ATP-binding protein